MVTCCGMKLGNAFWPSWEQDGRWAVYPRNLRLGVRKRKRAAKLFMFRRLFPMRGDTDPSIKGLVL